MKIKELEASFSKFVLDMEIEFSKKIFFKLVFNGKLKGEWDDFQWVYSGRLIKFSEVEIRPDSKASEKKILRNSIPLKGELGQLCRCYFVRLANENLTPILSLNRVLIFQLLSKFLNGSFQNLVNITPFQLDNFLQTIKDIYTNEKTIYVRANDLRYLIKYLCSIKSLSKKGSKSLIIKPFGWNHFLKNAINDNSILKISDEEKYPHELDIAIGKLRQAFLAQTQAETKPGYDSIRLNVLVFALSMGLRLGELTRLPMNALEKDDRTGASFLRVWTEKGALPTARPIPKLWEQSVITAYKELLKQCTEARERALEIEKNGFKFITSILEKNSRLTREDKIYLKSKGLSYKRFCLLSAITDTFDISGKQFSTGRRYSRCVISRPGNYRVLLKNSIESYLESLKLGHSIGDTFGHLVSAGGKAPKGTVSLTRLCEDLIGPISFSNVSWLKSFLINATTLIQQALLASEAGENQLKIKTTIFNWWNSINKEFDGGPDEHNSILIDFKEWCSMLMEEYSSDLQRHYKQNCDKEIIENNKFDYTLGSNSFEESVPLSNHLVVVWEYQFRPSSGHRGILPKPLTSSDLYNWLSKASGKSTVFERYNIRNSNGRIYSYSPHQFRHWVTTAFLRSGPNEMLIDLWMGRTPGQLRNYDHRTSKERAEYIRDKGLYLSHVPPSDWLGRRISTMRQSNTSESDIVEFIDRKLQILHFTPWGYCSRSLTVMPCQRGMMCLKGFNGKNGCEYFHIDPMDQAAKIKIQQMHSNYRNSLIALEPRFLILQDKLLDELDNDHTLDQHLVHIIQMIKGCEQALRAFVQTEQKDNSNKMAVRVFHYE